MGFLSWERLRGLVALQKSLTQMREENQAALLCRLISARRKSLRGPEDDIQRAYQEYLSRRVVSKPQSSLVFNGDNPVHAHFQAHHPGMTTPWLLVDCHSCTKNKDAQSAAPLPCTARSQPLQKGEGWLLHSPCSSPYWVRSGSSSVEGTWETNLQLGRVRRVIRKPSEKKKKNQLLETI